jgi:hypothetical protein
MLENTIGKDHRLTGSVSVGWTLRTYSTVPTVQNDTDQRIRRLIGNAGVMQYVPYSSLQVLSSRLYLSQENIAMI